MSVSLRSQTAAVVLALFFGVAQAAAAAPYRVAGSAFDASVRGKAIVWRDGIVRYWTDQGRLNNVISGVDADAAVEAAFRTWTDVPTAALLAAHAGQLGEDVRGADVALRGEGLELPADADISQDERLIVIYDESGTITDLRFGAGSSGKTSCVTNAAWSYVDSYAADGYFAHAVLVMNGNCFESTQRLKYMLVRAVGRLLGVGWSQLNDNAFTGKPVPTGIDFAGWPRMHPFDPWCLAYCNFDTRLRTDDVAAISHLYPLTAENVAQWTGKTLFHETSAIISGRVLFADGTPMQGVNVVARAWDPVAKSASRTLAVSGVSGAFYRTNRGNLVTGDVDANGVRFDMFGGDDPELEGYYELPGLPPGLYQISVEPVNPLYVNDAAVGASAIATVSPSGSFTPIVVGPVAAGGALTFDITMEGTAQPRGSVSSGWNNGMTVPASGVWTSAIGQHYGADFLKFYAKANRTFTFEITSLDESNRPTESKLLPVLGVWNGTDAPGSAPALWQAPLNGQLTGMTRLQAAVAADDVVTFAVTDQRGQGRNDFSYLGRLLYADTVNPNRVASGAGSVTVRGKGFTPACEVWIGGVRAVVRYSDSRTIIANVPVVAEGTYDVQVRDSVTGGVAVISNALRVGDPLATISTLIAPSATTTLNTPTLVPWRVRVLDSAGLPLAGEAVLFRVAGSSSFLACPGNPCTVLTNSSGEAQTSILLKSAGANALSAILPNGTSVTASVTALTSAYAVVPTVPEQWISTEMDPAVSVARVQLIDSKGAAVANASVTFSSTSQGAPAPVTVKTDASGVAMQGIEIVHPQAGLTIVVSACAAVQGNPCAQFLIHEVASAALAISVIQGADQRVTSDSPYVPIILRVTDNHGNPVLNAAVQTITDVFAAAPDSGRDPSGDSFVNVQTRKLVAAQTQTFTSSSSGTVAIAVAPEYLSGNLDLQVTTALANGSSQSINLSVRSH